MVPTTPKPKLSDFTRKTHKNKEEEKPTRALKDDVSNQEKALNEVDEELEAPPQTDEEKEAAKNADFYAGIKDALNPIEDYRAYLKNENIDEEEAACIVDDIFTKGYYQEYVQLTKKARVCFRTRQQTDTIRLDTALQVHKPVYETVLNEMICRYNLVGSLVEYNGTKLPFPNEKSTLEDIDKYFDERLTFVEKLPQVVVARLSNALAKFDRKVMAVLREGVAENF